jgi:hypothetical protein
MAQNICAFPADPPPWVAPPPSLQPQPCTRPMSHDVASSSSSSLLPVVPSLILVGRHSPLHDHFSPLQSRSASGRLIPAYGEEGQIRSPSTAGEGQEKEKVISSPFPLLPLPLLSLSLRSALGCAWESGRQVIEEAGRTTTWIAMVLNGGGEEN